MSIHQDIFDTLDLPAQTVSDNLGMGGAVAVEQRRYKLTQFLETNEWSEAGYKSWLKQSPQLPPMPSLAKRAVNLASAGVDFIRSGGERCDQQEADRRYAICELDDCGFFDGSWCRHPSCGCYMQAKTHIKNINCPVGLW